MSESKLTEIYNFLSKISDSSNENNNDEQIDIDKILKLAQHIYLEHLHQQKITSSIISKLKENKEVLDFFENDENQFSSILKALNYYKDKKKELEILNITLEKTTKEAIEREKRLDEAQKIAKIGSWEIRVDTNETIWSKELYAIFEIEEFDGINLVNEFQKKIHPEDITFFESMSTFDPKQPNHTHEFRIVCSSGIKTILATIYSTFEKGKNRYTLGTFQDITEQKIAQQKLIELKQIETIHKKKIIEAILLTKEREQKRIAEELHDDIGSSLMVFKFGVHKLSIPEEEKRDLYNSISDVVQKVRNISNELSPNILNEFGLINALNHYSNSIQNSTNLNVIYESSLEEISFLTREEEISIYRIVQEILNNILKYSKASNVNIKSTIENNYFKVSIIDNGNGFIPTKENRSKTTLGLLNIESRIDYINGNIQYDLNPNGGTKVVISKKITF